MAFRREAVLNGFLPRKWLKGSDVYPYFGRKLIVKPMRSSPLIAPNIIIWCRRLIGRISNDLYENSHTNAVFKNRFFNVGWI